jgi:hypothetical protein
MVGILLTLLLGSGAGRSQPHCLGIDFKALWGVVLHVFDQFVHD